MTYDVDCEFRRTLRRILDKTWNREFDCNRSANDLFRTLRRDFSKFASFAGPLAGGLGTAGIHFEKGPITEGRTIGITTGVISSVAVPGFRAGLFDNIRDNLHKPSLQFGALLFETARALEPNAGYLDWHYALKKHCLAPNQR